MESHKPIYLLILLLLPFILMGQENHKAAVMEQNKISSVKAYILKMHEDQDSFLITEETFNKKGKGINFKVYRDNVVSSEYTYLYKDDTIRIGRLTTLGGKYFSKTDIIYDRKKRPIEYI